MTSQHWRRAIVAPAGTHHLVDGQPLYPARFERVLKFHAPGLAPAADATGAFHITEGGRPAYEARFKRTFGFYDGRAAVEAEDGWCHILPDGRPLYPDRCAWAGNYQGGRCTVRCLDGRYRHLRDDGCPAYSQRWRYAGDFRDGTAVVQREDGMHTHIDADGRLVHGWWFEDLDVFHKGFARARDARGWHHVDASGTPAYARRFAAVEPFYNGQARVERFDGALEVIDERGKAVVELRPPRVTPLQALSADMVGFWRTHTIRAAVELGVLDALPGSPEAVASAVRLAPERAARLFRALWELELVEPGEGGFWRPTARGALLTRASSSGMDAAAQIWGGDHALRWSDLAEILREPPAPAAPRAEEPSYFQRMHGAALVTYQRFVSGYARHDYERLPEVIDWAAHQHVIDAGGGRGVLLLGLLDRWPHLRGTLLDLPEVLQGLEPPAAVQPRFTALGSDLFEPWPAQADAIVLARVLHDWPDEAAQRLLLHARAALRPGGRIFVVEMLLSEDGANGALLDLNMLVMTGGRERTLHDWRTLLAACGLRIERVVPLPAISSVLVVEAP